MGWRFRKSFSPLPGVRINLSPGGLSTSVGIGPFRLSAGPRGAAINARIPGTGISYRQPLAPGARKQPKQFHEEPPDDFSASPQPVLRGESGLVEIASAGSSELTSEGLAQLKELLVKARNERRSLLPELQSAATEYARLSKKCDAWKNGWLLRRVFRAHFAQLQHQTDEWKARYEELHEQEQLSRLNTQFDLTDSVRKAFSRLSDAFVIMSKSERVWDTISSVAVDRLQKRTSATSSIDRRQVAFDLGACDLIQSEWKVPHLANANGGDLFIYPGFILFYISADVFALVEASHVEITFRLSRFMEEEAVASDTRVVSQVWKKANKDGSPDRRFANNYQIPVVEYGDLIVKSPSGLNEVYMLSNASAVEQFAIRWAEFRNNVLGATANVPSIALNATKHLAPNEDEDKSAVENLGLYGESLKLATQKPKSWEYLLFAQVIIDEVEKAKRDLSQACEPTNLSATTICSVDDFSDWATARLAEMKILLGQISQLSISSDNAAFGPPGLPGSVPAIVSLARQVGLVCQRWVEWSQNISDTPLPPLFREAAQGLHTFTYAVIDSIERFANKFMKQVQEALSKPPGSQVVIDAHLKIDQPDLTRFHAAIKTLKSQMENV